MEKYTTPHIYQYYIERGGDLPYVDFRSILCEFNEEVMDQVLQGREFDMGSNLSRLSIMRINRDFSRPAIDWKNSYLLRDELLDEGEELYSRENPEGKKWFVYFTDEWYLRFYWEKRRCNIKGRSFYRFDATRGIKGNKTKLKQLLTSDPLAYLNFRTRATS